MSNIELIPAPIHPLMKQEQAAEVWMKLQAIKQRVREYEQDVKAGLIEWLNEQGRPLFIGDKMLVVGPTKTTKLRDARALLDLLVSRYGVEDIAGLLAAGAFKPGAAKRVLTQEEWDRHFEVVEGETLEVKEIDTRYTKGGGPTQAA
jgi:hypothetical protein